MEIIVFIGNGLAINTIVSWSKKDFSVCITNVSWGSIVVAQWDGVI